MAIEWAGFPCGNCKQLWVWPAWEVSDPSETLICANCDATIDADYPLPEYAFKEWEEDGFTVRRSRVRRYT